MVSSETELPYNYYSLPFCKPAEGVRKSLNSVNPGTILMGSRIENSPYNFSMLVSIPVFDIPAELQRQAWRECFSPTPGATLCYILHVCMKAGVFLIVALSRKMMHDCGTRMQVEEKTKLACQPEGFYGPLTERELVVSNLSLHDW